MNVIQEIRLFTFNSTDTELIKTVLKGNTEYSDITKILDNINEKNNFKWDFSQYTFIKDYVIKNIKNGNDLFGFMKYFPELDTEDYLKKCLENVNLFWSDDILFDLLNKGKHVEDIVVKLIAYIKKKGIWAKDLVKYLNSDKISNQQKEEVIDAWLLSKEKNVNGILRILEDCPSARGNKNLVNEYVYLCKIHNLLEANQQKNVPFTPKQNTTNKNDSDLVDNLILLGTGAVIGSLLTSSSNSNNDSIPSFSGSGGGEFGGAGAGGEF